MESETFDTADTRVAELGSIKVAAAQHNSHIWSAKIAAGAGAIDHETDGEIEQREEAPKKSGIKKLPNEILDQIFSRFDTAAPSSTKLLDQPTFNITSSLDKPLKNASLVCTRWRQIIIPILYKHACLSIPDPALPRPIMRNEYFPMLNFIRVHNLKGFVKTFALCVGDKKNRASVDDEIFRANDFTAFWTKILDQLDPLEVLICANPMTLGALTRCSVHSVDAWSFDMPYQILYLSRPAVPLPPSPKLGPVDTRRREPMRHSPLLEARPWYTLVLNEGSFIQAYKTYEFFHKQPPSILSDLLGTAPESDGTHTALLPPTIRDLSYIALFPTSQHFHQLAQNLPRLDRFYTQFVPRNDILQDASTMAHLDAGDLWMERNSCYAFIMRELFSAPPADNYAYLRAFESGDHADEDAWEMAVEYVKRTGRGWKIERRGVFVKDAEEAKRWEERERAAMEGGGVDFPSSLFQGSLHRWAFAGVMRLPVSSMSLYFRPQN